jgi:hypothetical protein
MNSPNRIPQYFVKRPLFLVHCCQQVAKKKTTDTPVVQCRVSLVSGKGSTYIKDVGDGALSGGGGGVGYGEVYKKTIRSEPNMMLVFPIKIYSRV